MGRELSVQVPPGDEATLAELAEQLGIDTDAVIRTHPFDGQEMLHLLVPASAAALTVLRTWIKSHYARAAHYRITYRGTEIIGYSADEVERLIASLAEEALPEDGRR